MPWHIKKDSTYAKHSFADGKNGLEFTSTYDDRFVFDVDPSTFESTDTVKLFIAANGATVVSE